ncbi:type I-U CRISPR-associated protein Cas5/Cas6 [Corynebacterium xerosis]|uniref:Type I-U CRISPR-associated protein Cas5/Cas6 n=1 Tax=Corynebacterium xerosis TaxID=1725 RepID=A0A6B8TR40_9CORY|nr:type I-U CRISPR-associated protein Csb2 [Corynebacterium xerosis]QGS35396.1 type I-U CRISPR-associated protein Cas5/Cas6 [Corynebacterium xerosis]
MRDVNLIARFPLGVYIGHTGKGAPDRFPSPLRLHSALLNAAGQGTLAVEGKKGLEPSGESLNALEWLEANPPSGIQEPVGQWVAPRTSRFIYREVSAINEKRRTEQRRLSTGRAVSGNFGYHWTSVPSKIADTIERLCADVSCLGETESVAILEPGPVEPTLVLDPDASVFDVDGTAVLVAAPGRTAELVSEHAARFGKKPPTVAADKKADGEKPRTTTPVAGAVRTCIYRDGSGETSIPDAPWERVLLLELSGPAVPVDQRVEICLALHRALVAAIGDGASAMVTGKEAPEVVDKPANRLAIQYFHASHVAVHGVDRHALGLLLPSGATDQDLVQLAEAIARIKKVWSKNTGKRWLTFNGVSIRADEFWPAPSKGQVRVWHPDPVAISEIRPPRVKGGARPWTLADMGLLALGFVWRDRLSGIAKDLRGIRLYEALKDAIESRGVLIMGAKNVGTHVKSFTHRTQADVPAQTWTGRFYLGNLVGPGTLLAVGQSRHLGGGLLVPEDIPVAEFSRLMLDEKSDR